MDELDQSGSCIDDMSSEQLESSDTCNSSGEPEIVPRIGDQYQAEIPPLLGEFDCELYKRNPMEVEETAGFPFNFLVGLPIPVIWKKQEVGPIKLEATKSLNSSENSSDRNGAQGLRSFQRKNFCLDKNHSDVMIEVGDIPGGIRAAFATPDIKEEQMQCMCPAYHLVPGSDADPWSDNEKGTFLLGLYIFEKNFVQVKRFLESKTMGDILSFYYGKFYGSHEYRRWSDCRKAKGRKCVHGDKLFTEPRQQELLSRLLPSVSNEGQTALLEVTKTFGEGKMSLEEYVFTLKAMIGTNILVEAVGIGKGKQDLTCMAIEFSRSSQGISVRSEIPIGKACADLEPSEIIKFLTGNYRLSKARASDLFWEAVWPRLLARGWQSEQPKNEGKDSLVFLVPGVKKFSRRKLVKGKQYFDSVTDILSRVAAEPALLELKSGDVKANKEKEEDEWTPETKEEPANVPTPKRHSYLQPRTKSRTSSGMEFTVVDTSLADGRPYKLKELRSLPLEASRKKAPSGHLEDGLESSAEVSGDESDTDTAIFVDQIETDDTRSILHNGKRFGMPSTRTDNVVPPTKRQRRLTACNRPDICSSSVFHPPEAEILSSCSVNHDTENDDLCTRSSQCKVSSTATSQGCHTESIKCAPPSGGHVAEHQKEHQLTRVGFDLNVPQLPPDFESVVSMQELDEEKVARTYQKSENRNVEKIFSDVASSGQQHEALQRRQSTRNRPPTARALEALANGLISVNSKPRKNRVTSLRENLTSRSVRKAGVTELSSNSMESRIAQGASGVFNSHGSNLVSDFQVSSEAKGPATAGL